MSRMAGRKTSAASSFLLVIGDEDIRVGISQALFGSGRHAFAR